MTQSNGTCRLVGRIPSMAVAFAGLALAAMPASGALTAYYTLDNTSSGLLNNGTDGATSNLSLSSLTPNHATPVTTGMIGSALHFAGNTFYTATASGNAAEDMSGYPLSFSIWIKPVAGGSAEVGLSVSDRGALDRYFSVGVNGSDFGQLQRRSSGLSTTYFGTTETPGSLAADSEWHNLVGVVQDPGEVGNTLAGQIFLDGKYVYTSSLPRSTVFSDSINTIGIGGISRTNSSAEVVSKLNGAIDDAGLFNDVLTITDAALINGLGQTSGLGLNWHDEAALLNASAVGTTANIGGKLWERVTGLTVDGQAGVVGDHRGTFAAGDAFIVTGTGGNGIQMVPEPAFAGALIGMGMLLLRRVRARA